jgi:hypothetical protein
MADASLGIDSRRAGETAVQYSWTFGPIARERTILSGSSSVYASAHDLVLFGMMQAKACQCANGSVLSDASIDTMQRAVVPAAGGMQYGLGWWVESDRFGYRSVLAQGGTDASSTWLRVIPSERITAVVLANKGVGFPADVVDAMIAALLPRYGDGWTAKRAAALAAATTAPVQTRSHIDAAFVGDWRGIARTKEGDVPIEIAVAESGSVRARIGRAADDRTGRAKLSATTLQFRIPGDLETSDSTVGRQASFYLRMRSGVLNGTVTTNPHAASHLEGRVSDWVELRKAR